MRSQKSLGDLSSARSRPQRQETAPPVPSLSRSTAQKSRSTFPERSRGHSSSSSSSSNASSILDGRKQSYDSSTSYEDDRDYKRSRSGGKSTTPSSRRTRERYERDEEDEPEETKPEAGHGTSIWNAISGLAGSLTVNVSKAWEGGVATADGEVTPPGQESRLTKAMKDYHLKTARSAKDLPGWLFNETERRGKQEEVGRAAGSSSSTSSRSKAYRREEVDELPPAPRRGLRDIYEQASSSAPVTKSSFSSAERERSTAAPNTSKASSRLQALKDARRAASSASSRQGGYEEDTNGADAYDDRTSRSQGSPSYETPAPPSRVGLPTGPRRR